MTTHEICTIGQIVCQLVAAIALGVVAWNMWRQLKREE